MRLCLNSGDLDCEIESIVKDSNADDSLALLIKAPLGKYFTLEISYDELCDLNAAAAKIGRVVK